MRRRRLTVVVYLVAAASVGCATTVPYVGQGPHPQITRGRPVPIVDFWGNVFGLSSKLVLWEWKIDQHWVSEDTERYLVRYIDAPETLTEGTHYSLNEYAPGRDFKRLWRNRKVAWPYRLLIGLPLTLLFDVLLPGRVFGGDHYNPYTDRVSLYSDHPAVALHEAGHSHDFNKRRYKGSYAFIRFLMITALFQEYKASEEAINGLEKMNAPREVCSAYDILYPAYGTYVGNGLPVLGGFVIGAAVGHILGRMDSHRCRSGLRSQEHTSSAPRPPNLAF
ncbi:MAG: hypothetical protein Q8R91_08055 [Candidatus Omnitrophota bacterium]|nr:hypothetical protein [Candidatus Omnitrophota bacterium]